MSRLAEIVAFVSLADGGLSFETMGRAIRRRWPQASQAEIDEALVRAAKASPDAAERAAIGAAAIGMMGKARSAQVPKPFRKPNEAVRAPFR